MKSIVVVVAAVALSGSIGLMDTASARAARLAPPPAHRQQADGKAVYLASCKQCHGVLGEPTKASLRKYEKIATFRDPSFFVTRSDDSLRAVVRNGAGRDMKPFKDKLSAAEIDAVVKYIHTLAKHDKT